MKETRPLPPTVLEFEPKQWTLEGRVIVALMRRLGTNEVVLPEEELHPMPTSMYLLPNKSGGLDITVTE